mmetsp:Transcript_27504/g.33648  ORF Transcript_27504/g.33648 Transcript_27504/m.33648 type:complete len:123 (+) Transcript_27504:246-614(+)
MENFVRATQTKWTQVYFIAWYFFFVVVVLNSITSFVVEALTAQHKHRQQLGTGTASASAPEIRRQEMIDRNNLQRLGLRVSPGDRSQKTISRLLNDVFDSEVENPTSEEVDRIVQDLDIPKF